MDNQAVDFVIIGAGSAGCVLADKLSENGKYSILLLEAGETDRRFSIKMPLGYGLSFYNDKVNYKFETTAQQALGGRRLYVPRGKIVGGSGSINAMVYYRGLPHDFEDWAKATNENWAWESIKKEYEELESRVDIHGKSTGAGPLPVADLHDQYEKMNRHFFKAAQEINLPTTTDMHRDYEGIGNYQANIKAGQRFTASDAFLQPALKRQNLQLISGAQVQKIKFEGKTATSIVYIKDNEAFRIHARREIILSAGAIQTPQLLQNSGIGPGEILQEHGIETVHENQKVGQNLQDHLAVSYYFKATEPTLNNKIASKWGQFWAGANYVLRRRGPLSLSVNQCGGFVKTDETKQAPDTQFYLNPITYTLTPDKGHIQADSFPGFITCFQPCRPTSKGYVKIQSVDMSQMPEINLNALTTNEDIQDIIAGGRLMQKFVRTTALQKLISESLYEDILSMDDTALVDDFKKRCGTVYHPVGTCGMGKQETAVLSPDLKVNGVHNLRVVDASAFPNITSGNTNAPTMMLASKAAKLILSDH